MIEKNLTTWEEFCREVDQLKKNQRDPASLLFRGQDNSNWGLSTTLDRSGAKDMAVSEYYRLICKAKPAIESLTKNNWKVPEYDIRIQESFRKYDEFLSFPEVRLYSYMIYLRHHGFPSPLLDWSLSPFVAAFFAFWREWPEAENRSIFVYCEMPSGFKTRSSDEPYIRKIGPYIRSHSRHFLQQSSYTACGVFQADSLFGWSFAPHDEAFRRGRPNQDVLWKFIVPSSERPKVLKMLDEYNLNAFSLFGTEEALAQTIWARLSPEFFSLVP